MRRKLLLAVAVMLLPVSHAMAQYSWCCENTQHAGGTSADRCERNRIVFATKAECEAHKEKHDKATGHKSTCR